MKYSQYQDNAPKVLARGKGKFAERIMELAVQHGIPLAEKGTIAEELYQLETGCVIPEELYEAVAEILAYVVQKHKTFLID